jgi:FAD/FMN-containing dehydrogenase
LSLGGGFGWLTGEHGLTIDNIEGVSTSVLDSTSRPTVPLQHRIVTPSGEILNANAKENSDLYWGLRGGGGNFGVVTEFIYKLHPQRKTVYFGKLVYTPDKLEKIMEILGEWWNTGIKEKEGLQIALTIGPNGKVCALRLSRQLT